ncbi:aromatic ring-hydroxylating dioxygenase subunit alpha [Ramlibacter rhizophilus]|uniref:Aromatic ring-hydroxylating dioxygenase subunit alpha n=1 Tax=Ramlibacter rhizophilus TaxID=1781167 RepID=A0A4Z0BVU1_9BURK|nr:aromatic ring-hydroxylating dioxygenase subunit alpha [Ramlibacter rhizophilus]TFZ03437.1 aromatic ring-hydroxylating dioxygenase subunit alpha [Ramlibacter rhizophilus]
MFIMNAWYIAAWASEIGEKPFARTICNEPLVFFRDKVSGKIAALEDKCCHRAAPLSLGVVVEAGLQCGYHGVVHDCSGRCVHIPGQDKIPARAKVRAYPAVEKNEFIWVWMGNPELADESKIIDYPFNDDHEKWPHHQGFYHIKSNYVLMVDNLMDLTHLGYVHGSTIGGNPQTHVEALMDVHKTETSLSYVRWMLNSIPPPTYVAAVGFKGRVDRWQEFEFAPPSNVLQWSGAVDAGTGARENGNREGGFSLRIFHGLTPETENSCFYFYAPANGYRQDDPTATDDLMKHISTAFMEDLLVCEGQQKRLERFGESDLVDIASDASRIHLRRIINRMEQEDARLRQPAAPRSRVPEVVAQ